MPILHPHRPLTAPADGAHVRVVEKMVMHGAPVDFRALCERAVPRGTRYLILDLDRTTHLGRNLGELLGWELVAWHAWGEERLAEIQDRRPPGRIFVDRERPLALLRYLLLGVALWAWPGLYYLAWGKLVLKSAVLRRLRFLRFGPEPVSAVQRIPQLTLLRQMAQVPVETLRTLARRVWARHAGDQTILREDLDWLRARCPGIRIIISSASPQPMVEAAAEALGVDEIAYSALEEVDGVFSAPHLLDRRAARVLPRRIAPPGSLRINSSWAKIDHLLARFPDLADPATISVGISDTGYGEDHPWAEHLTRVIDVNSTDPFPPIATHASPLEEVHSAALLTRDERARLAEGRADWASPRRRGRWEGPPRVLARAELETLLAPTLAEIDALTRRASQVREMRDERSAALADRAREIRAVVEADVEAYNQAEGGGRRAALTALRRDLARARALQRRLIDVERPLSELAFRMEACLADAHRRLGAAVDGMQGDLPGERAT